MCFQVLESSSEALLHILESLLDLPSQCFRSLMSNVGRSFDIL
jgi:hypothetical protein